LPFQTPVRKGGTTLADCFSVLTLSKSYAIDSDWVNPLDSKTNIKFANAFSVFTRIIIFRLFTFYPVPIGEIPMFRRIIKTRYPFLTYAIAVVKAPDHSCHLS